MPVPAMAALLSAAFATCQPVLASALGVTRWAASEDAWRIGLTLIVWHTALAVAAGVLLARRLIGRPQRATPLEFVTGILPAALGALLATPAVVLVALPATVIGVSYPSISAGLSVSLGATLGLAAAAAALAWPAVARGLLAGAAWGWAAGVLGALLVLGADSPGSQPPGALALDLGSGAAHSLARNAGLVVAVVGSCAAAAWATRRSLRCGARRSAAVAGALSGGLLVAAAYLTHPAMLVGENRAWFVVALVQLVLGLAAAVAAAVLRKPSAVP